MQPHRAPAARCPRVPVPPLAPGLLPRDSPRGFTTCRAPAGEGEPVGAGEPPRTRGAGPDTCAGYNLATSLGGHHDPCAAPQGQAWDPQASTHLAFPSVCPSVRHSPSARCLLLGEPGPPLSRTHLARAGRGAPTGPTDSLEGSKLRAGTRSTGRPGSRGATASLPDLNSLPRPTSTPAAHRQGPHQVSPRTPPRLIGKPQRTRVSSSPEQPAPHRQAQGLGLEPCALGSVLPAGQREDTGSCCAPHLAEERHGMGCPT